METHETDPELLCDEPPLSDEEIQLLRQGYNEAMRGELLDARQVLAEIRAKYRLPFPGSKADELRMIREGYEAALRGEVVDAKQAIGQVRAESGL